jgi:hypothetical protein
MRYRALDSDGDAQFGRSGIFLTNSPQAVAQAVLTRLKLWVGEWMLDNREGTDYSSKILGYGTQTTRDIEVQERILNTQGVKSILSYQSTVVNRVFSVSVTIDTDYGATTVTT